MNSLQGTIYSLNEMRTIFSLNEQPAGHTRTLCHPCLCHTRCAPTGTHSSPPCSQAYIQVCISVCTAWHVQYATQKTHNAYTYKYVHTYVYKYVHTYVYKYVYTYVYTYIHTSTYIHWRHFWHFLRCILHSMPHTTHAMLYIFCVFRMPCYTYNAHIHVHASR